LYRKILIIRFSSIGDLVLTTPAIRCLKNQTESELHLVTKEKFAEVLINNPNISRVWTIQKDTAEIIRELRAENFDFVIDLHYNFRSIKLTWQLRKPFIRFDKLNFQKWLMTAFKINRLPHKHLVDRYFDALGKLGIKDDGKGLDFYLGNEGSEQIVQLKLPEIYVVGVLGATYYTKQIPLNKWIEILHSINLPLVLIGGANEKQLGSILFREFPLNIIDCTGKLSISQSAKLIRDSKMVITPDTGMMHIAAALRKPLHVIWGNTIPDFGMYPYFGKEHAQVRYHEVQELSCRPCSKLGYQTCPKKHFDCMQKQTMNKQTLEL
jgi:ADP-heptose:LPS heptosyltransferase